MIKGTSNVFVFLAFCFDLVLLLEAGWVNNGKRLVRLAVLEIQGCSTGLMMSQLQEGIPVEITSWKRMPDRLGSLNDSPPGSIFQRSCCFPPIHRGPRASNLPYWEKHRGIIWRELCTCSSEGPNGAVFHTDKNSGDAMLVTSNRLSKWRMAKCPCGLDRDVGGKTSKPLSLFPSIWCCDTDSESLLGWFHMGHPVGTEVGGYWGKAP